jgi:hypothetical protein
LAGGRRSARGDDVATRFERRSFGFPDACFFYIDLVRSFFFHLGSAWAVDQTDLGSMG